jgi:hypothetical protein
VSPTDFGLARRFTSSLTHTPHSLLAAFTSRTHQTCPAPDPPWASEPPGFLLSFLSASHHEPTFLTASRRENARASRGSMTGSSTYQGNPPMGELFESLQVQGTSLTSNAQNGTKMFLLCCSEVS